MKKRHKEKLLELFKALKFEEMESYANELIRKNPNDGTAWKALGAATKRLHKDGLHATRKAVELLPKDYEAHFNLGVELQALGKTRDAIASYNRAIALNPNSAKVHNNLGNALKTMGMPYEALSCYHKAMQLDPSMEEAYLNMGNDLLAMGQYAKAIGCFKKTLDMNPNFIEAYSNLIFTQDLMPNVDAETHQIARKDWAANYVDHLYDGYVNTNDKDPNRKLRIGYMSGDFKEHSAARVFGAMLCEYDRTKFDVYCYSNLVTKGDRYTEKFKAAATGWRDVSRMKDPAIVKIVKDDKIDILVDLSGHSALNRLAVFAFHPAPVQITAWGYATGTGLAKMDAFFADKIVVPQHERQFFTEKVVDLPCVMSSYFQEEFPAVTPLPSADKGIITFGCFNRLHKVSQECFGIWVEILKTLPTSRLLLKAGELLDDSSKAATVWNFTKEGINPDRIKMLGSTPWIDHVSAYSHVDIALDPFPHGGGVTTMEGLMMGVPVVTLRWPSTVGRNSASLMTCIGREDWIAETASDYVKLAVAKTIDLTALAATRESLRGRFMASCLGDHKQYVAAVENRYRELWVDWCKAKTVDI